MKKHHLFIVFVENIAGIFRKYILDNDNITNCLLITMSPDILMKKKNLEPRRKKKWIVDMFCLRVLFYMIFFFFFFLIFLRKHIQEGKYLREKWENFYRPFLSFVVRMSWKIEIQCRIRLLKNYLQWWVIYWTQLPIILNCTKKNIFSKYNLPSLKTLSYNVLRWNNNTWEDHHQECFNY